MTYRVRYLCRGVPFKFLHFGDDFPEVMVFDSPESARRVVLRLKAKGLTAWVETSEGAHVPVEGATRKPRHL